MRTRYIFFIVAVLSLTISSTFLTSNAAPNPIEIISISEVSSTSVEILFSSSIPKNSLSYYVINAVVDYSVGVPKNIKKVIKTKATGLITAEIKNLNPKAIYNFSISAKTNKGKMINSEAVEYSSLSILMDALSNLPADWGNPKPIQLPTVAPTSAPVVAPVTAPAFTLSSSSETRTVKTAATGFTISSTGGVIASFGINSTPAGMSFNTTTGALAGTPNTIATATNYTITATNSSGSTTQTFRLTVIARYCDGTSFTCEVGDTGPGSGKIYYYSAAGFDCGPEFNVTGSPTGGKCHYLEVAPKTWDSTEDPSKPWAVSAKQSELVNTTGDSNAVGIGRGYRNSGVIVVQNGAYNAATNNYAAGAARAYSGGSKNDWYLPAWPELNELYKWANGDVVQPPLGTVGVDGSLNFNTNGFAIEFDFIPAYYWSSSEDVATKAWNQSFNFATQNYNVKSDNRRVRPIRAF